MSKKVTIEEFIRKAKEVHKDNYEYFNSVYVNNRTNIIITCKEHGDFEQTPYRHICRKQGCPDCSPNKKLNQAEFLKRAKAVHGDKYDYGKAIYKSSHKKVLIGCHKHGYFLQAASAHSLGSGCPKCGSLSSSKIKTKNIKFFIDKAIQVHGNKYCYLKSKYISARSKLIITCPIHGDFQQTPSGHTISKNGCPKCANYFRGFSKGKFKQACDKNSNGLGTLYIIRCFSKNENFYKVGITSSNTKNRYINKKDMPYRYETVFEIVDTPNEIFDLEKNMLRAVSKCRYKPLKSFAGETECFLDLGKLTKLMSV